MTRRFPALLAAAALALAPFSSAQAAPVKRFSEGLNIPISATSVEQGSFTGALEIQRFARVGDTIVALGTVTGTLTDETGVMTGIVRNVSLPVALPRAGATTPTAGAVAAAAGDVVIQQTCDVLHLVLGPLHLDLLGLIVDLNEVHLDITADPAGGLLGSLLCAIAGLLGGTSPLEALLDQLVDLLNQILAILG